ncbi:MAG: hypothetical protein FD161_1195 [Limisphaerales bacterium]|nr:MAG: hypothetical protein FD161_1195 [Limisphaerales bacterium]TXT49465.1 MAG: hypothetical protein FD140_2997 [Limisphaerales bacterium]
MFLLFVSAGLQSLALTMTIPRVNRLLVVGPARTLRAFVRDDRWMRGLGARSFDLLECAPSRHAWQFETDAPPVTWLRRESRGWPALVFVLDYDREAWREKGLLKARRGRVAHHRVRY